MDIQNINTGSEANDRTGDPIRNAFIKINHNFTELYPIPLPPTHQFFSYYTRFNFPTGNAYGYQSYMINDRNDQSPATDKWEINRNVRYVNKNSTITKIARYQSSNVNADFAIVINPIIGTLVSNTTWDYETEVISIGPSTKTLIEPNLTVNKGDTIGIATKTTNLTTRIYNSSIFVLFEAT
jgi:hypothetical protein